MHTSDAATGRRKRTIGDIHFECARIDTNLAVLGVDRGGPWVVALAVWPTKVLAARPTGIDREKLLWPAARLEAVTPNLELHVECGTAQPTWDQCVLAINRSWITEENIRAVSNVAPFATASAEAVASNTVQRLTPAERVVKYMIFESALERRCRETCVGTPRAHTHTKCKMRYKNHASDTSMFMT